MLQVIDKHIAMFVKQIFIKSSVEYCRESGVSRDSTNTVE